MSMKMDNPSNDRESLTTRYGITANLEFSRVAISGPAQQSDYFLKN